MDDEDLVDIEIRHEDIVLRPTDIANHPGLIEQFGVIGVDSAIEFDIYGNVNSRTSAASG